ncbi:MAG: S9 family peptidase [Acidobacteria bacterium]|nr:MAG: S9 family peptidase [Acidobacteriota bacterium]
MLKGLDPAVPAALVLMFVFVAVRCGGSREPDFPPPPETRTEPVTETLHGEEITDPYRWLEDQDSPETRAFIAAQNAYTDQLLGNRPGREELREGLEKLLKVDVMGVPTEHGGRYFYSRRGADQDQPVIWVREGRDGAERVLLDPAEFSEDGSKAVSLEDISRDGKLVAYSIRSGGEDEVEIRFRNVASGKDLPDVLPRRRYFGIALLEKLHAYAYTEYGPQGPRLFLRRLGEKKARKLFGDGYGPEKIIYAREGEDGRWLVIHVLEGSAGRKTEVWLHDLEGRGAPRPVTTEIEATFSGQVAGGRLYLETNWQAPNGRVMVADAARPAVEGWRELIPERENAALQGFSLAGGRIYANYLENVQSHVIGYDPSGRQVDEIAVETIGTIGGMRGRWDSDEAFYTFSSFHVPTRIYRYDLTAGKRELWFAPEVPIDPDRFAVEQVRFTSKDGTEVPMFIVHRKGWEPDGDTPTLLYGYGGFRVSVLPRFSAVGATFVDRGGVYAVANLRGGGEFGEPWHQAGMLANKQHTFDDFIAAAEWLIAQRYTNPRRLAIYGGSNGGLLVGAAMTQRPDLFQAVVCAYPLLDMLRYDKFLVGRYWVPEYGTADDPEQFKWLRAYSPYHNVREGVDYPAVLFVTGDGDTRVAPLHARKMAALMQAKSALRRPVMLRYHEDEGHAGGTPLSQQIEDATELLTFLSWQLGMP